MEEIILKDHQKALINEFNNNKYNTFVIKQSRQTGITTTLIEYIKQLDKKLNICYVSFNAKNEKLIELKSKGIINYFDYENKYFYSYLLTYDVIIFDNCENLPYFFNHENVRESLKDGAKLIYTCNNLKLKQSLINVMKSSFDENTKVRYITIPWNSMYSMDKIEELKKYYSNDSEKINEEYFI